MTSCHKKCLISSSNPAQVEMPLFEMMFWNITSWHENASHNSGPLLGDISVGFPSQLPVMWSCGVFFIASLNNPFYKESSCRWFETPCRLCDATVISYACNIQDPCHNFPRAKCVKAMERGVTSCVVVWRPPSHPRAWRVRRGPWYGIPKMTCNIPSIWISNHWVLFQWHVLTKST